MRRAIIAAGLLAAVAAMPAPALAQGRDLSITIGPGGVRVDTDRDRDRRGPPRPRCYDREEFRRALAYQGWRDPHDWEPARGPVVRLKARQWGGLYRLEVDECYAQLIEAKRIDFSRDRWDRDRWERDYYRRR